MPDNNAGLMCRVPVQGQKGRGGHHLGFGLTALWRLFVCGKQMTHALPLDLAEVILGPRDSTKPHFKAAAGGSASKVKCSGNNEVKVR